MLVKLANSAKAGISFLPALWALAAVLVLAALTALPHPLLDHSEEFRTLHPQYRGDYRGYLAGVRESRKVGKRESGKAGKRESGKVGKWESGKAEKRESGKVGKWESGKAGKRESGKVGKWESGKMGKWESGKVGKWGLDLARFGAFLAPSKKTLVKFSQNALWLCATKSYILYD